MNSKSANIRFKISIRTSRDCWEACAYEGAQQAGLPLSAGGHEGAQGHTQILNIEALGQEAGRPNSVTIVGRNNSYVAGPEPRTL